MLGLARISVPRKPSEAFGEFVGRVGFEAIREFQAAYAVPEPALVGAAAANGNGNGNGNGSHAPAPVAKKAAGSSLDKATLEVRAGRLLTANDSC